MSLSAQAQLFRDRYESYRRDPYQSAFTYGRKQVDAIVRRALGTPVCGARLIDAGCGTGFLILEERPGVRVFAYSYPSGSRLDFDETARTLAVAAGYACTTINGVNDAGGDLFELRRMNVQNEDDMLLFRYILWGALDWLALKRTAGEDVRCSGGSGADSDTDTTRPARERARPNSRIVGREISTRQPRQRG